MEDFGIIIACYNQDYLFAKGCCASIRHFLGDVPICLIVDGTFSVSSLEKTYGVHVINRLNVTHEVLRKRSFGWGITKMIAFWESPWQTFLFLDADTIIWGDVLKYANFRDFDVIVDRHFYTLSAFQTTNPYLSDFLGSAQTNDKYHERILRLLNIWFFNLVEIGKHFPNFRWQSHLYDYFCSGAFFARRGIFTLDEYINILDMTSQNPYLFGPGEMGFLNFMVFCAVDEGRIRLGQEANMQLLVCQFDQDKLRERFPVEKIGLGSKGEDATVIHWSGLPKPTLSNSEIYSEPMTYFRRKFQQDAWGRTGWAADAALRWEEIERWFYIYKNRFKKKLTICRGSET